ncbi:Peptidase family M23 [Nocardia amikacinitolerans]|uniref:M23 family metallopeptidase n=1 Tax=Nocardia amikacinitolerans TaxID=756689 RepID=UPI0020A35B88|nr:Peptidase family M23 [Nocardia amikacinitolerans]
MALAVLLAACEAATATAAPGGEFGWPLRPRPTVERRFDRPAQDWLPGHRGVDLAGTPGQTVVAAGAGIVVFAGEVAGKPVVSLDHPGGLRTTYEPVRARVSVGARVSCGTPIGTLEEGHADCAAPACLHWGLRREAGRRVRPEYLDPLGLLHFAPLRLEPVEPGWDTAGRKRAALMPGRTGVGFGRPEARRVDAVGDPARTASGLQPVVGLRGGGVRTVLSLGAIALAKGTEPQREHGHSGHGHQATARDGT